LYEHCRNFKWKGRCDDCFQYCLAQGEWPFDDSYGFWCA
jgi:hypothetical protein